MRLRDIYVRPGVGQAGVGLICIRAVPRGTVICTCTSQHSTLVPVSEVSRLPRAVRNTVHELFDGVDTDGMCRVPNDFDQGLPLVSFINHSSAPNCRYDEATNTIVAARRLRRGEEATVDYLQYQYSGSYTYRYAASGFRPRVG